MSSIDVVVPCYRYGHFLRECVESVLAQKDVKVRILVIDDASPDNTAEVATKLTTQSSRVTFVRHATNKGHIATYNEGIDWASADYYMILSADDYLLPGALRRSTELMKVHPEVGFAYGRAITLDDRCTTFPDSVDDLNAGWQILPGLEFIKLSGVQNKVATPTAVVRTELQKRLGGYRPELPHTGDLEMWLRLAAHGAVGISDANHAVYRQHGSNMSMRYYGNNRLRDLQQRQAALDCFLQHCSDVLPNAPQLHRRLFRLLGCEALQFAGAAFNAGELEASEQLSDFAFSVCPKVRRSALRIKLACKRGLGLRAWRVLRPASRSNE
jgi:glycosyltransferase involved in cell wall biosynthesis